MEVLCNFVMVLRQQYKKIIGYNKEITFTMKYKKMTAIK